VFGVILGTGVGGGLVVRGELINGRHGIGGEWGHNFLHESGGSCYCGKTGCVENVISGKALEAYHSKTFGERKILKQIYVEHLAGNANATKTIDRLIKYFGQAISVVINIVDPDIIIIGGGVGNIDLLYSAGVEEVKKHIFNPVLETKFCKPELGDSAGVFGAAFLVA
jgi:predicted NBD/HSP70 family sugar kinase